MKQKTNEDVKELLKKVVTGKETPKKVINQHDIDPKTWLCKYCHKDHPAFDMPCVDRYE